MSSLLDPRLSDCRRIFLEELAIEASIGFHDFERAAPQRILICVDLFLPKSSSSSNRDDVADVLDYDQVREGLTQLARSQHFNLQETLIDAAAQLCLGFSGVRAVLIRTQKPDVYPNCKTVGIESFFWSDGADASMGGLAG